MKTLRTIAALLAAVSLSAPVWANPGDVKECEADCREETVTCEDMCDEHAGAGADMCKEKGCRPTEIECIEECNKGYD